MAARIVNCAKLGRELPGIDEETPAGSQALKWCLLIGGPQLRQRVFENVSAQAWEQWRDHMVMVFNEFRLDPNSPQADAILRQQLEDFLFGRGAHVPNFVPPPAKE